MLGAIITSMEDQDSASDIGLLNRFFRLMDSGMTQTVLGIIGGLAGTFLDGRCFLLLTPLIPAAIQRNKVLEGVESPLSVFWLLLSFPLTGIFLLWFGVSVNKARPNAFTPRDFVAAVRGVLPSTPTARENEDAAEHLQEKSAPVTASVPTRSVRHSSPPSATPFVTASPVVENPALKLLSDGEALNSGLIAYRMTMRTDYHDLNESLEVDRRNIYGTPQRAAGFEVHKQIRYSEQVEREVRYYKENYASEAVRVRRQLLEAVPEAGTGEPNIDFANPFNGAQINAIQGEIERLLGIYKDKLTKSGAPITAQ